jgi:hypothetical protein
LRRFSTTIFNAELLAKCQIGDYGQSLYNYLAQRQKEVDDMNKRLMEAIEKKED